MIPYPYQSLKLTGETERHWNFICPFHTETQGSFSVNKTEPYSLFYRCWACDANGSAKSFAIKYLGHDEKFFDSQIPLYDGGPMNLIKPKINWEELKGTPLEHIPAEERRLADAVGLSVETIRKFKIGWKDYKYLIPMYDEQGICGIATRIYWNTKFVPEKGKDFNCAKRCIKGSKHGFFYALNQGFPIEAPIFVTEGWSDCATITELGFHSIGRFNAAHIENHVELADKPHVYIISDSDECGRKGSLKLQKLIGGKIIYPEPSFKDVREMYLKFGKEQMKQWLVARL